MAMCEWFALCENEADGIVEHPILGTVPTCKRCAEKGEQTLVLFSDRLEYLRGEIQAERISYGEIAELQSLVSYIDRDDRELLQWAGVSEEEYRRGIGIE